MTRTASCGRSRLCDFGTYSAPSAWIYALIEPILASMDQLTSYTRTVSSLPKAALFTRYCISLARSRGQLYKAVEFAKRFDMPALNVMLEAHKVGADPSVWRTKMQDDLHQKAQDEARRQTQVFEMTGKAAVAVGVTNDSQWAAP